MALLELKKLPLKPALRDDLASEYANWVNNTRTDRDDRMKEIWALALKNYEGHAEVRNFPWPNASNAVLGLTPSHVDAWQARLLNAGTAADPVYMISAWSADDLIGGMNAEDYAEIYQQYSKWLEKEEIDNEAMMEKVTTIVPKYGNAIVYLPWEHETVMHITYPTGSADPVKTKVDVLNKPVPYVIHPKNFYMDVTEEDLQTAQRCGFDVFISEDGARAAIASGEWDKKAGNEVLKFVKAATQKQKTQEHKGGKGYFKRTEDGRMLPPSEWDDELKDTLRVNEDVTPNGIPLVRIFAREDTDADGTPEEIELLLHVPSQQIVMLKWSEYAHMKRPLVMFSFKWREGTWLSIGVAEMLFNPQRIMNEIVRDMLDNNKIKNTKVFAARANGVVDPDEPIFPGRTILMEEVGKDFAAIDLGSGTPSTSLNDLAIIQSWAERRDGMTDFNLGRERSSRTPATTMLALLEEGNERVTAIIRRQRRAQGEIWTQVHQLYAQKGDAEGLDRVVGKEDAEKLRAAWAAMNPLDIRKALVLNANVSTGELNRSIKRMETAQLMGQLDAFHSKIIQIAEIVRGTADPVLRALAISMAKSGQFLMQRVLNTYDIRDKATMNPDLAAALEQVPPGPPVQPNGGQQQPGGPEAQVEQATGQPSTQPLNAPGRPEAGVPRGDGGGGA